jgi:hypothetical protein
MIQPDVSLLPLEIETGKQPFATTVGNRPGQQIWIRLVKRRSRPKR